MTTTQAAIDRMTRELDYLVSVDSLGGMFKVSDLSAVLASHDKLNKALAFYANSENWQSPSRGFAAQYDPQPSPVSADRGARALAALATPGDDG